MDKRYPTLVSTSPVNYEKDVAVNTSIRVEYNIDLDSRYINGSVYLTDSNGEKIEIRTAYKSKTITVTPLETLNKNTTYQLTLVGDSNVEDSVKEGIRSIIGDCMSGNYTLTFSTERDETLIPPTILYPPNGSVIRQLPTFKWMDINSGHYNIELSKTKSFAALVYPTMENQVFTGSDLTPDLKLEDGIYYYRIRQVGGEWSAPHQFNLDTLVEGPISEEDAPLIDEEFPMYDEMPLELELIDSFPKDLDILIPTNVKSLYFRVIGDIDVSLLDVDSFALEGTHISGDFQEESHGVVKGRTTVVEDTDGTSYILFTPDPIPVEESEM